MCLKDINIICNQLENENFLFFAEFFKMCGIYVVKSTGKPYSQLEESEGYTPDAVLDLREKFQWLNNRGQENKLFVEALKDVCKGDEQLFSELGSLVDIYIDNNLMLCNMMERYFYAPNPNRVEKILEGFQAAYKSLEKLNKGRYVDYFGLICRHKINSLRGKLRRKKIYDSRTLISEAVQLGEKYQEFTQEYILAGIIADGDLNYLTYSIIYYNRAYDVAKPAEPAKAYIEYRRGRYYERIDHDVENALKAYTEAYKKSPSNYRILFKKAFLELDKGYIWQEILYTELAKQDFYQVYLLMCDDINNNNLEPIQLEYLTKTLKKLYEIYDVWLEKKENARQILSRLGLLDYVINADTFFDNIFQNVNEAKEERALLIQHLNINAYKESESPVVRMDKMEKGSEAYAG